MPSLSFWLNFVSLNQVAPNYHNHNTNGHCRARVYAVLTFVETTVFRPKFVDRPVLCPDFREFGEEIRSGKSLIFLLVGPV